jgi:hypothetical protein
MDEKEQVIDINNERNERPAPVNWGGMGTENIVHIWLMFLVFVLVTYNIARREHINPFASLILGLSLGSAFIFNKTTFSDLDSGHYYFHLAIVFTGILAIIYLWRAIINDRDDIRICASPVD